MLIFCTCGADIVYVFIYLGKTVRIFIEAILNKKLGSIVALIAGRGRGKSAVLGLSSISVKIFDLIRF